MISKNKNQSNKRQKFATKDSELTFNDLSKIIWRRRKITLFSGGFIILMSSLFTLFLRIYRPIYEGNFSLLISDPINSEKQAPPLNAFLQEYVKDIALNQTNNDITTLISFLRSPLLLANIEEKNNLGFGTLRKLITIKNDQVDGIDAGGILNVTLRSENFKKGNEILIDISDAYLKAALVQKQNKLNDALLFLDKQTPNLEKKTRKLQNQLAKFREKYSLLEPAVEGLSIKLDLTTIDKKILDLESKNERLYKLKQEINNGSISALGFKETIKDAGLEVSQNDEVIQELISLEIQLAKAKTKFTNNSQVVKNLTIKLNKNKPLFLNNQLEAIDSAISFNSGLIETTNSQKKYMMSQFLRQPNLIKEFNDINQNLQISKDNLISLIAAKENLQLEIAQNSIPWRVISSPKMSNIPVEPSLLKNFILSIFFGSGFGIFCGLVRDRLDDVFHNSDEVKSALNLPILTEIPYFKEYKDFKNQSISLLNDLDEKICKDFDNSRNVKDGRFFYQESFRKLYTSIRFLNNDRSLQCISLTSSISKEGKTLINIILSKTLSEMGQKVLLIDCDLSKPSIDKRLGINNLNGLSNILSHNKLDINSVIQPIPNFENLNVITAGSISSNSLKLFSSKRFKEIIDFLKVSKNYDYILLDNPSILEATDTLIISEVCDGIIFLVSLENIEKKLTFDVLNTILENSNIEIIGIVVNQINKERNNFSFKNKFSSYENSDTSANKTIQDRDYKNKEIRNSFSIKFLIKKNINTLQNFISKLIIWLDQ